jgi:hypothetical protein
MKKGKTSKINNFESLKVNYGTVDSKNLKSIYINIQSWVNPKIISENWNRIVCNFSREIKHTIYYQLDRQIFEDKSIVDLDLRTSGIVFGKKSFLNLEINLFTSQELDFKSNVVRDSIKKLVSAINSENFKKNNYFDFTLTKNGNPTKSNSEVYL